MRQQLAALHLDAAGVLAVEAVVFPDALDAVQVVNGLVQVVHDHQIAPRQRFARFEGLGLARAG